MLMCNWSKYIMWPNISHSNWGISWLVIYHKWIDPQFPNHKSEMMSPGLQCNKKESYLWLLQKKGLFSSSSALAKLFTNLWTDESCLQKNISASFCAYWMLLFINQSPLPNLIDNEFSFVFVAWNYLWLKN